MRSETGRGRTTTKRQRIELAGATDGRTRLCALLALREQTTGNKSALNTPKRLQTGRKMILPCWREFEHFAQKLNYSQPPPFCFFLFIFCRGRRRRSCLCKDVGRSLCHPPCRALSRKRSPFCPCPHCPTCLCVPFKPKWTTMMVMISMPAAAPCCTCQTF